MTKRERGHAILRPAMPADVKLLRYWDQQSHIIAAKGHEGWGWEAELKKALDWQEQLIAEVDGHPIGFIQVIDPAREESRYWGNVPSGLRAVDIWIGEKRDLGKGYGTQIMQLALARCFADPTVTAMLVDLLATNTRAHRFYERLGFQFVERGRFGADECLVYLLDRADYTKSVS